MTDSLPTSAPAKSFDRIAKTYDATRDGDARGRAVAALVIPHLVPGPVLEVGIGTGAVAAALAQAGHPALGVDISAEMLRQARQRLGARVTRGDARALPYARGAVPNVLCAHVLHLVGDMDAAVAEAARVLAPGGRLVAVHGETYADPPADVTEAMKPLDPLRERPDTVEGLARAAGAAGLRTVTQYALGPNERGFSPEDFAGAMEARQYPYLWDVTEPVWRGLVEPVIAALRALPEPARPRPLQWWSPLSVFAKDG
ncbi:class I SAM-dependent methyltransferase [Streptomyces sp. NPDC058457]|uniref:class I SAM-dependent methyltransferase n=1 Tax=Streptomyces sp. NPDC058457 TaxID=3346507 RepID=UPI00365D4B0A